MINPGVAIVRNKECLDCREVTVDLEQCLGKDLYQIEVEKKVYYDDLDSIRFKLVHINNDSRNDRKFTLDEEKIKEFPFL